MMQNLERRLRKLESSLPPLLTENVSWMFGLLWFAVTYYLGNPSPDEKPFAAFARALRYANESELNAAIVKNRQDLSNRLHSAEDRVYAKFGIYVSSLEDCEFDDAYKARFWESLKRMEAGLPRSYRDQLEMVLTRVNNLAWMRVHSNDVAPYLRCFTEESGEQGRGVNLAYLREIASWATKENGSGSGMRLRKRPQKKS